MTLSYATTVFAENNIYNVPEKINCAYCKSFKTAFRNSDVELSENRKPFKNFRGEVEYEEDYKCEYSCPNCNKEFTVIVRLK